MDVLSGPTHKEGQAPVGTYFLDGFGGSPLEHRQAPGVIRVRHIEQVMRDSEALLQRGLGRADIHASVEQPRICRDDLAFQPLRQGEGEIGLPDRSRPDDDDEGRLGFN
jgi:hypothetical protein